jgi:hypothetical protein
MKTTIPERMLPVEIPQVHLPSPEELGDDRSSARESFDAALERAEDAMRINRENFARAMKRIRVCSFLHGFTNPFVFTVEEAEDRLHSHYSWCPAPHWDKSREDSRSALVRRHEDEDQQ